LAEAVTGLVLAGGQARRMGGGDKGLRPFRGLPLAAHAIARLRGQVDQLIINANQNLEAYRALGYPVIADAVSESMEAYAGPLAGLYAGLSACSTPLLVTVPCDSPLLPLDLVARLRQGLVATGAELAVARSASGLQSVFSLCRRSVLDRLAAYLEGGGRKVDGWHASLNVVQVDFPDEGAFVNINTLAELEQLEKP